MNTVQLADVPAGNLFERGELAVRWMVCDYPEMREGYTLCVRLQDGYTTEISNSEMVRNLNRANTINL